MEEGIVLIDKPAGWTSFDIVAKIRGHIRRGYTERGSKPTKRQLKVGHAGTLDPFATGLLVILLGDATKKATEFLKLDKVYEAEILLGKESTTGDPEGEITDVSSELPTKEVVEAVLAQFTGEIIQRPPIFSAIKINGQRAYKLARDGKKVEIPEPACWKRFQELPVANLYLNDVNRPKKVEIPSSAGRKSLPKQRKPAEKGRDSCSRRSNFSTQIAEICRKG